jgi:hypothetical protein
MFVRCRALVLGSLIDYEQGFTSCCVVDGSRPSAFVCCVGGADNVVGGNVGSDDRVGSDGCFAASFSSLRFWINGGSAGLTNGFVSAQGAGASGDFPIPPVAANQWSQVTVPLASIITNASGFDAAQDRYLRVFGSGATAATVFLDDIELVPGSTATTTTTTATTTPLAATTTQPGSTTLKANVLTSTGVCKISLRRQVTEAGVHMSWFDQDSGRLSGISGEEWWSSDVLPVSELLGGWLSQTLLTPESGVYPVIVDEDTDPEGFLPYAPWIQPEPLRGTRTSPSEMFPMIPVRVGYLSLFRANSAEEVALRVCSDTIPGDTLVSAMKATKSVLFELSAWQVSLWSLSHWSSGELSEADEAIRFLLGSIGCEPIIDRTDDGQWWTLNFRR